MKTLVIHPLDGSTTFLTPIYENIEDKTILTMGYSQQEVYDMIPNYERVIMMGHGSPNGLFSVSKFSGMGGYIIDYSFQDVLANNPNNIYIWCYASSYVRPLELKGITTGMFISEQSEVGVLPLHESRTVVRNDVQVSNRAFAEILGKNINLPPNEAYENTRKEYGELALTNKVANYNCERLLFFP